MMSMLPIGAAGAAGTGSSSGSRSGSQAPALKSDLQYLREAHRFLRTEGDEDGSWEARLARKYYDRLFREYVVCDLAGYKKGEIGFRWRTEGEVVQGKGQFHCGQRRCASRLGLRSYEVDFKYRECSESKRALVKVRLCEKCAYKLHYKRLKAERKRQKKEEKRIKLEGPRVKRRKEASTDVHSSGSEDEGRGGQPSNKEEKQEKCKDEDEEDKAAKAEADEDVGPDEAEKLRLEALAWKGPNPDDRTREDDFDDFFGDLFM